MVHALVTCHPDYCNSPSFRIPYYQIQRLQCVLNAAARVVCLVPKFSHITQSTKRFALVTGEISYYIQVYKVQQGITPVYLASLLKPKAASLCNLRNQDNLLQIPNTKSETFGDRAFFKAVPTLWNSLALSIKNQTNIGTFKSELKTHLCKLTNMGWTVT